MALDWVPILRERIRRERFSADEGRFTRSIVAPRIENEAVSCPCEIWASEYPFELANVLALLRDRHFQLDTIPKPGGLRFRELVRRSYCPAFVQLLSRFCPANFQPQFALWSSHGKQISGCSKYRKREAGIREGGPGSKYGG